MTLSIASVKGALTWESVQKSTVERLSIPDEDGMMDHLSILILRDVIERIIDTKICLYAHAQPSSLRSFSIYSKLDLTQGTI